MSAPPSTPSRATAGHAYLLENDNVQHEHRLILERWYAKRHGRRVAFKDIHPAAPTHILIVPKKEIPRLADAKEEDQALLGHLLLAVGKVARQLGVDDAFKVAIANGEQAGQTVFHLHLHLMAGKRANEKEMLG